MKQERPNGLGLLDVPHEEVQIEDLIGLNGTFLNLIENGFWVILFNSAFIGVFTYLPYITGDYLSSFITKVFFFFFLLFLFTFLIRFYL